MKRRENVQLEVFYQKAPQASTIGMKCKKTSTTDYDCGGHSQTQDLLETNTRDPGKSILKCTLEVTFRQENAREEGVFRHFKRSVGITDLCDFLFGQVTGDWETRIQVTV